LWPSPRSATLWKSSSVATTFPSANPTPGSSPSRNSAAVTEPTIALVGNPNTGKTTLFNALTGLRQHVGNYPGVTVEIKTGSADLAGVKANIVDVPGCYSLAPRSLDELLAVELLLGLRDGAKRPDAVVCVVDASNLERNLYLASQVVELGIPTVIALNMMDVAESRGLTIDPARLAERLGAPVVPIVARSRQGLGDLSKAVFTAVGGPAPTKRPQFPTAVTEEVASLGGRLQAQSATPTPLFLLERVLFDSGGQVEKLLARRWGGEFHQWAEESRARLKDGGTALGGLEAHIRYAWIGDVLNGVLHRPTVRTTRWTDRLDAVLLHRFWGVVVFLLVMSSFFATIFFGAASIQEYFKDAMNAGADFIASLLPEEGALHSLVRQGALAGVINVLVFLPQIAILFAFLAVLEDCGYMARAAFLMDRLLSRCGLSGKSFIPMLSSFACAVPGVMATRTIEDPRDRLATMLVAPLMSCSARLPLYTLLISAFVPGAWLQTLTMMGLYSIGLIAAPLVALALKRTFLRGEPSMFLLELPSYKAPQLGNVLHRMADRSWAFIRRAGTFILATSIVLWALAYYPRPSSIESEFTSLKLRAEQLKRFPERKAEAEQVQKAFDTERAQRYQEQSFLARMGKTIEPLVAPLGWDWKIGTAVIASFPAREVVVAALGTIYSVGEPDSDEGSLELQETLKSQRRPDGTPVYNLAVAASLLVFFALCCQCVSTLAVIRRETNTWRWPIFTFVYMTLLAYLGAFVTYRVVLYFTGA
jgi:ferrous iron transport protein B